MTTKSKATKAKAPTKATAKTTTTAKAKKKPAIPSTTFTLYAPEAASVFLSGDFNDWHPGNLKARKFKDGTWRKTVPLKAGTYQYLFLVDGQWWADPANPNRAQNPFGSENSVITIG